MSENATQNRAPELILNPLANPKGVNKLCELCQKPAFLECLDCRVTYYWLALWTLYGIHCALYIVHCTSFTVHRTLCTVYRTLYTVNCTMYNIALYIIHMHGLYWIICNIMCAMHIVYFTLYSVQFTMNIIHITLYNV